MGKAILFLILLIAPNLMTNGFAPLLTRGFLPFLIMNNFLITSDFSHDEIESVFDLALKVKQGGVKVSRARSFSD